MPLNLPNILTLLRIAAIPVLVLFAHLGSPWGNWGAAALFGAAALTDLLDGWLARRSGQTTVFGAFLDPVADKLIVATALVLLTARFDDVLITLCACVVIGREVVVSALREWMARLGKEASMAVNQIAKVKTNDCNLISTAAVTRICDHRLVYLGKDGSDRRGVADVVVYDGVPPFIFCSDSRE